MHGQEVQREGIHSKIYPLPRTTSNNKIGNCRRNRGGWPATQDSGTYERPQSTEKNDTEGRTRKTQTTEVQTNPRERNKCMTLGRGEGLLKNNDDIRGDKVHGIPKNGRTTNNGMQQEEDTRILKRNGPRNRTAHKGIKPVMGRRKKAHRRTNARNAYERKYHKTSSFICR